MSSVTSKQPIADTLEFEVARDLVGAELARINPYLKLKKQQGNVDFFVNAAIPNANSYDPKLTWLTGKNDAQLIKDQIVYIRQLEWLKQAGKFDKSLVTQFNKSISIATASVLDALMAFAWMKISAQPSGKMVWNMQQMSYRGQLPSSLLIKARWVWDLRQSIHLQLRQDEAKNHSQVNLDKGLLIMDEVVDHWHDHFQYASFGIHKRYT